MIQHCWCRCYVLPDDSSFGWGKNQPIQGDIFLFVYTKWKLCVINKKL